MYLRHKLFFLIFPVIVVLCLSCKKYLDAKPDDGVSVPESLEQIQALLDNASKLNHNSTPNFGEGSCDDFFLIQTTYDAFDPENKNIYTWTLDEYKYSNDWSNSYEPVYISNFSLEALQKIAITNQNVQQWNNAYGSALFYRSYYFLQLLWVYAKAYDPQTSATDLGIALRLQSDFNVPSVRSSAMAGYHQVVSDTKKAIPFLPDFSTYVTRPTKAAAYGLLARAYLSMRIYDSALLYSTKSLSLKSSVMNFNSDPDIPQGINALIPFKKFNKETVFYSEMGTTYFINAISRAKVDTVLLASYRNNDLRRRGFYRGTGIDNQFKGSYTGNENQYFTGLTTVEMKLSRIECIARTGNWGGAMNELNELLQTRWDNTVPYVPLQAATSSDALSIILSERRKELYMRGLRWMDIKRLNKEGANITLVRKINSQTYTLQPNANYYALPLPSDIIELTGMPQNPR